MFYMVAYLGCLAALLNSKELASANIALVSCLVDYYSARVAESADAGDSKSLSLRGVRVQVPPRAHKIILTATAS